jgi:hypothetical protein
MSMIASLERVLIDRLPPRVVKSLQELKAKLPTRLPQAPPVAVMYVADGTTRSYVGLNNFYSFLLAHEQTDATADLEFFSPSGRRLLRHSLQLAEFGARSVDVSMLFAQHGISSPHGIVTAQITPRHPRRVTYRELGAAYSQFFVFYTGGGSVAQVHPLSQIGRHNRLGEPFESSQWITTRGLERLEVLQYNPCAQPRRVEHRLLDARTRELVAKRSVELAARGSARSEFSAAGLPAELLFAMDRLPSENSKPMLRRVYASNIATMSHA